MTEHSKADEARKGLIDSVKGKAKEIAGAVTGNDSLTAEGQLEQTQAQQRKEANSVEAVADAEAAQARAEAAHARVDGAQERIAVNAETAAVQNSVREQQAAQKRAAEQTAQQDAARAKTRAELDAQREVHRAKAEEREESAPQQSKPSMPRQNIRARCGRLARPRQRPTASGCRPTNCPTKPTCPEPRPEI
jgi:uncharacterized protein YjbJ (UPF0337 family)